MGTLMLLLMVWLFPPDAQPLPRSYPRNLSHRNFPSVGTCPPPVPFQRKTPDGRVPGLMELDPNAVEMEVTP